MNMKKKSLKQENNCAEIFGGKTRGRGSGASWSKKADVKTDKYLIENKYTDAEYFTMTARVWEKIRNEAIKEGLRTPLIQLDIQDNRFIICDWNYIRQFVGASPFTFGMLASKTKRLYSRDMEVWGVELDEDIKCRPLYFHDSAKLIMLYLDDFLDLTGDCI